jgi:DNA-binding response OmpR family regulator
MAMGKSMSALQPETAPFKIGESLIDPKTLTLSRGDLRETLTARELHLLQIFHQSPEEVFSRDRLLSEVWGYEYYGTTRTLDQVIVQLRKKLGESGGPKLLLTVHGVGYRLRVEAKPGICGV